MTNEKLKLRLKITFPKINWYPIDDNSDDLISECEDYVLHVEKIVDHYYQCSVFTLSGIEIISDRVYQTRLEAKLAAEIMFMRFWINKE